ncbi:MAG: signal peptidase I [Candidatus Planktophila sp.]
MLRQLFDSPEVGKLWIEGESSSPDSRTLLTISNQTGEHTVVITPTEVNETKSRLYVQAPPERVVVKEKKFAKASSRTLVFLGYVLTAVLLTFVALSATGRLQARIVLTGSMEPAIHSGDIVILDPATSRLPKIGDVVTYTGRRFDGTVVASFTHRIISGDSSEGYVVKGDANANPDVQKVPRSDVEGIVVYKLPGIGKLLLPKTLFTLIPLLFIAWLLVDKFRNDW